MLIMPKPLSVSVPIRKMGEEHHLIACFRTEDDARTAAYALLNHVTVSGMPTPYEEVVHVVRQGTIVVLDCKRVGQAEAIAAKYRSEIKTDEPAPPCTTMQYSFKLPNEHITITYPSLWDGVDRPARFWLQDYLLRSQQLKYKGSHKNTVILNVPGCTDFPLVKGFTGSHPFPYRVNVVTTIDED